MRKGFKQISQPRAMEHRIVKIRPQIDLPDLLQLAQMQPGLQQLPSNNFILQNCPSVAVMFDYRGEIHWPSTLYLAQVARDSRSTQGRTVETYGESLAKWFDYLASRHIDLAEVAERDLRDYRNVLCQTKAPSKWERYAAQTINLRVMTPLRFHAWGNIQGEIPSPLGEWAREMKATQIGAWFRRGELHRRGKRLTPAIEQRIPRILTVDDLKSLFANAKLPFSLMFKWAVVCGLRRFEICGLCIDDLPPIGHTTDPNALLEMRLLRKGGRIVTVYVPTALVEESRWYLLTDRPRAQKGFDHFLFLGKSGAPISCTSLSKEFRKVADKIGSDATLHHLRHTFAVIALRILQSKAELGESINPLKTLQILLGHASIESTEIYLRAMDIQSDAVEEALDFLYGATI